MRCLITFFLLGLMTIGFSQAQTTTAAKKTTTAAKKKTSHSKKGVSGCPAGIDVQGDHPMQQVTIPPTQKCSVGNKNGFLIPDPNCTPGAVNPTLTLDILKDPHFTTKCVRDRATTLQDKAKTYKWYKIPHPANNTGASQSCELDHLISLELGGADTLDNLWPQCGPSKVSLNKRFFKRKDTVENYLAKQVRDGTMSLEDAQKGIATDWTQYLTEAEKACPGGKCK
jgi:hypothetical protein